MPVSKTRDARGWPFAALRVAALPAQGDGCDRLVSHICLPPPLTPPREGEGNYGPRAETYTSVAGGKGPCIPSPHFEKFRDARD